ncbi:MAG: BatD family protein [Tannerellaceae bacterium]|jgi:hypothetical protein|nr:BatD family protein [Tannerellaceae bacterium]
MVKHAFLFIFFYIATVAIAAQEIVLKTEAPDTVTAGKLFKLTYTVNAPAEENSFRMLEEINGIDVLFGPERPSTQNFSIVNGQMLSEYSLRFIFTLLAQNEGSFALPAATVRVNNADYTSNARSIMVLPPDTASSDQYNAGKVFMLMDVSKNSVYEQEEFLATFKIYSEIPTLKSIKIIDFPKFEGFTTREIDITQEIEDNVADGTPLMEDYNGAYYYSFAIRQIALTPTRTGMITIGGGKFVIFIKIETQKETKSIFDILKYSYRDEYKIVTTEPTVIEVKPLPAGKAEACTGKAVNRIAGAQDCLLNTKTL